MKPVVRVRTDGTIVARRGAMVGSSPYAAAQPQGDIAMRFPTLRAADAEVLPSRDKVTARGRDLDRNNGWVSGGIDTRVDAVVGTNIWLDARPDWKAMGQTAEWADEWGQNVESKFRTWANDPRFLCDVERHQHFGGLVNLAYRHYAGPDGECAAAIYFRPRGGEFATSVLVVDPDRISNPHGAPDSDRLRGGVAIDQDGGAIGYHVRNRHPNDHLTSSIESERWTYMPRESSTGRPLFVHAYAKRRAHQRRGISRLASVIPRTGMLDKYDKAELEAALLNAIMAPVIESPFDRSMVGEALAPAADDGDTLSQYQAERIAFHEQSKLSFGGTQITHLYPNETLKFLRAERPSANFAAFEAAVIRSIASAFGLSYEQLSRDWSQINYSSARTLLNEIWRGLNADRHQFSHAFCTPIYTAWLEEAVAVGAVPVPGGKANFYRWRAALTQCRWVGPGRGFIDPKKEAEAAGMRMALGISTLEDEAGEQGNDWLYNIYQKGQVQRAAEKEGVQLQTVASVSSPEPETDEDGEGNDPDREGDGKFKDKPGRPKTREDNE